MSDKEFSILFASLSWQRSNMLDGKEQSRNKVPKQPPSTITSLGSALTGGLAPIGKHLKRNSASCPVRKRKFCALTAGLAPLRFKGGEELSVRAFYQGNDTLNTLNSKSHKSPNSQTRDSECISERILRSYVVCCKFSSKNLSGRRISCNERSRIEPQPELEFQRKAPVSRW
jgi:hypothetical protein